MRPLVILPPSPSLPLQIRLMNNLEAISPEKIATAKDQSSPGQCFPVFFSSVSRSHRDRDQMTNAILSFHQWNNPSHTEGTQKGSTTPPLPEAQKITHGRRKQFPCM
ncbi:hypothetical protein CEXT_568491 [Caerostris extrusa]|uniref:Uncharacterized protein n=1 Tax=Caerostris extrusa TaxID=172846 RepID=A0AAV4YEZ9_CAEEX|nr:hypothetical protein CEXT_568491 [Caerostris extrusa]